HQDGREEPPPAQAGVHRRSEGGRPVQRRLEDQGSDPRATVEPVHPGQRWQEGRPGEPVIGLARLAAAALMFVAVAAHAAVLPSTIRDLAQGEPDARDKALAGIVAAGDASALPLLQSLLDGDVKVQGDTNVY